MARNDPPTLRPHQERDLTAIRAAFANGAAHDERRGGALIELSRLGAMSYPRVLRWAGQDEHRLRLVAQARGYKQGWVWRRLQELRGGGQ